MNRYRHRRLRTRVSILAIVALLWSQVLLAGHPVCSLAAMALAEITVPAMADRDCHHPEPSSEAAVCNVHCSQGEQSSEVGRVPHVPALAPQAVIDVSSVVMLEDDRAAHAEWPPPLSWHRPTSHPASLLLI